MMIRHIFYFICRDGDPREAQRVARIANSLNKMRTLVILRDIEYYDHQHKGLINAVSTLGIVGSSMLDARDIKLAILKPQQTEKYVGAVLRKQHTSRARQEVKRFSLNPGKMNRQRNYRF